MNHEFRDISLADRELIESYTRRAGIRNCDLAFANIFCWREVYRSEIAVIDGFLVIRFRLDGSQRTAYMQPLGDGDFGTIIPALRDDARQHGQRLRIAGLTEEGVAVLRRCGCGDFAFCSRRATEDYLYLTDDLRTLSGRRYQPKRNHINRFTQLYDYRYEELAPHMLAECMRLEAVWRREHTRSDEGLNAEQRAMQEAFDNFAALGLRGGCIYVGGRMVAFTYGSAIDDETFCIHIEKADTAYEGAFAMINKLFAENLPRQYRWLNREEDLGIPGLRQSKLSYHPAAMQRKFTAQLLHHDETECKELWMECFDDEEEFVDAFLAEYYARHRMLSLADTDGRMLAMLHIVPMRSRLGRTAYVFGVATAADRRGCGMASELMRRAMVRIDDEGYDAAILIPSGEALKSFYARFGFEDTAMPVAFDGDFDFGTGTPENDLAMIRMADGRTLPDVEPESLVCTVDTASERVAAEQAAEV